MVRAQLDLSHGAPEVYAFAKRTASWRRPVPLADVALIVWGII
jgi:hypothetical protein